MSPCCKWAYYCCYLYLYSWSE